MNEIIIKEVVLADLNELISISKKTFYDAFVGTCTPADMNSFLGQYYNEIVLTEEINNPNYKFYFALSNNEIVGYSAIALNQASFENKKAIELKRFYIVETQHGKGVAQIMMKHFLNIATSLHYEIAYLGVWEYNYKAQNFYKKYGFVLTNLKHSFPVGNTPQTDVYMKKILV